MVDDVLYEIVVKCDDNGVVESIEIPKADVSDFFEPGQSFMYHIEPESLSKALTFMMRLRYDLYVSNHEVNFLVGGRIKRVLLSGFMKDERIMIIATSRVDDVHRMNEEIMKINSEQVNQFRIMLKEKMQEKVVYSTESLSYLDEISKLNNELMNSKRELAKKNQELNGLVAELERLATRDPLTGLFNRRLLAEKFAEEKRRAERLEYPLALAVIDINHFKKVNDLLGHAAGDDLLKAFANLVLRSIRESLDHAFRIGGDEFLILLSNCDVARGEEILKRINDAFVELTAIASLAYGVIEVDKTCEEPFDRCIMKADALMFENKKLSR